MQKVSIHSDSRNRANTKIIKKAIIDTLAEHNVEGSCEVSVAIVGKRKMAQISKKYLGDDKKHELLSFPFEDITSKDAGFINPPTGSLILGEIVLCWPHLVMEAAKDDVIVDDKMYELACHATEHLLGYHHES